VRERERERETEIRTYLVKGREGGCIWDIFLLPRDVWNGKREWEKGMDGNGWEWMGRGIFSLIVCITV
jgi:hypothetical protein